MAFAQRPGRIVTVDVMPVAVGVEVDPDHPLDPGQASALCRTEVVRTLRDELSAHGYRVAAFLDERGRYSRGRVRQAMSPDDLAASRREVARFAAAQRVAPGSPAEPALPLLGRETGSDATLFVSGSGHAPTPEVDASGIYAALGLLAAVGTVAGTAAVLLDRDGEPSPGRRVARAASFAVEGLEATAVLGELAEEHDTVRRPPPRLRLTMTLVDNRTGAVLWHSDRGFRVSPIEPLWIRRSLHLTADRLPCGGARPGARARGGGPRELLRRSCHGQPVLGH